MDSVFKQTLRAEMDFQDIKVKELANRTGISQRTLEGYLGSRASIPPADVAVKIANALNVSVEYLVTGKNNNLSNVVSKNNELDEKIKNLSINKKLILKDFIDLIDKDCLKFNISDKMHLQNLTFNALKW